MCLGQIVSMQLTYAQLALLKATDNSIRGGVETNIFLPELSVMHGVHKEILSTNNDARLAVFEQTWCPQFKMSFSSPRGGKCAVLLRGSGICAGMDDLVKREKGTKRRKKQKENKAKLEEQDEFILEMFGPSRDRPLTIYNSNLQPRS